VADLPKVEPQNTGQVLKHLKDSVVVAKKELETGKIVVEQVRAILKQNEFYEREIDGARGRIFMLLVAQTRNAEVASSEEYIGQINAAIDYLTAEDKKAKAE